MTLKERIISSENIYAAIYAMPTYVAEKGLMGQYDGDIELYQRIYSNRYVVLQELLNDCRKDIQHRLDSAYVDLYDVKVWFRYKKIDEKGDPLYRPIHHAELKTLICLQAMANVLFFDDDTSRSHQPRKLSDLACLVPQSFYGNILSELPERIYCKWTHKYQEYIQLGIDKYREYAKSKVWTHQAYLDLVNFFPNVNIQYLYGYILGVLGEKYQGEDQVTLKRVLQLLLHFKIKNGGEFGQAGELLYYGKELTQHQHFYTRGLPQGLPHIFFFANIFMRFVSEKIESRIHGDIRYYVDDITAFCNEDQKMLLATVEQLNQDFAKAFDTDEKSPIKAINTFMQDNNISFIIRLHEDEKCASVEILDNENALGMPRLTMLARNTSMVNLYEKDLYDRNAMLAIISMFSKLTEAIDAELKRLSQTQVPQSRLDSYKKRLKSYKKFYDFRRICLQERIGDYVAYDELKRLFADSKNIEKQHICVEEGPFQTQYRHFIQQGMDADDSMFKGIKDFDCHYADVISLNHNLLYYTSDAEGQKKLSHNKFNTAILFCLESEARARLWREMKADTGDVTSLLEKAISIEPYKNDPRKFVFAASDAFKSKYITSHICVALGVSLAMPYNFLVQSFTQLQWYQLRLLNYLYSPFFKYDEFRQFGERMIKLARRGEDCYEIDMSLMKVLPIFRKYLHRIEYCDNLIRIHQYVTGLWKNGSKFLHFYTLHNQEHSMMLIETCVRIMQMVAYYRLSETESYILFLACYLHDLSLPDYHDVHTFPADALADDVKKLIDSISDGDKTPNLLRNAIIASYETVDRYFEELIRNTHVQESARRITAREFPFIDDIILERVNLVAFAHGQKFEDVYGQETKIDEEPIKRDDTYRIRTTALKSLLRIADSLDMSADRVSPISYAKENGEMPSISRFHWLSHLVVKGFTISTNYSFDKMAAGKDIGKSFLTRECFREEVSFDINFNIKTNLVVPSMKEKKTKGCGLAEPDVNCLSVDVSPADEVIEFKLVGKDNIEGGAKEHHCERWNLPSGRCPLLCKWMMVKNPYIFPELQRMCEHIAHTPGYDFSTNICVAYHMDNQASKLDKEISWVVKYLESQA